MNNFENLEGKRFGNILVVKYIRRKAKNFYYEVECQCGCMKHSIVHHKKLRDCRLHKSCGNWRSPCLKEIGLSSKKAVFYNYKKAAKYRGLNFEILFDEFIELSQKNCFYCGCSPRNKKTSRKKSGDFVYNGLDRVDNKKGYSTDNVVPACKRCNFLKGKMTQSEFFDSIRAIYKNLNL